MSKRRRKRSPRTGTPRCDTPKPGPGDVYVGEFVSARTGRQQRIRNVGEHPLTLAHTRRKITDEQFAAGEELRRLFVLCAVRGRDSTELVPGSSGGFRGGLSDIQIDADRKLQRLRAQIKTRDWIILEKFCGEGWSMAESVRAATVCHPSGILYRMQEALDELVSACGARLPRVA